MSHFQSSLLRLLDERGYIHQATDAAALDTLAAKQVVPGYIGFDATAPSLHVGSLVQIMMLRRLQQAGHKPIVLMGGGTTKVGDPSGKDESRRMLGPDDIAANIASIRRVFEHFLTFGDGPTDAVMVDNDDWLSPLGYLELLRTVGPHFTINRMMTFDSVKLRLDREQPLTFLEFNYMILQAYDFRELALRSACRLQMGGSDQWGNIINGIELARRMDGAELFGVTTPLITTADGAKMGKTAAGAVWLNADLLSAYDYWQFWRNCADADVEKFLKLFTDLPIDRIAELTRSEGQGFNDAKITLAVEATALLHGREAANNAEEEARRTFREGGGGGDSSFYSRVGQLSLIEALVGLGFAKSKNEARRLVDQRSVKINDRVVTSSDYFIPAGSYAKISKGKKQVGISHSRTHENDIAHAILEIALKLPNYTATFDEIYDLAPHHVELNEYDTQYSFTRPHEQMWQQLVRNIRSHQSQAGNYINEGYLTHLPRIGYQLTEKGRQFLLRHAPDG